MKKITLLLILTLFVGLPAAYACDIDGDGIDDLTTFDNGLWTTKLSSDSSVISRTFGTGTTPLVPGKYFTVPNESYAYVDDVQFWWNGIVPTVPYPNGVVEDDLNFGRVDVSYMGGKDYDGDGVDDPSKYLNRCNNLTTFCHRSRVRINIARSVAATTTHGLDKDSPVISGFFGRGLSSIAVLDADADGDDDICYTREIKTNPRRFKVRCKDVTTEVKVAGLSIGRMRERILSLSRSSGEDYIVKWRKRPHYDDTKVWVYSPSTGKIRVSFIPGRGEVVTADWLGSGNDQVGVSVNGTLNILNVDNGNISSMALPGSGDAIDCENNFTGPGEDTIMTTRNVCQFLTCP